jgi:hypothetical protein
MKWKTRGDDEEEKNVFEIHFPVRKIFSLAACIWIGITISWKTSTCFSHHFFMLTGKQACFFVHSSSFSIRSSLHIENEGNFVFHSQHGEKKSNKLISLLSVPSNIFLLQLWKTFLNNKTDKKIFKRIEKYSLRRKM